MLDLPDASLASDVEPVGVSDIAAATVGEVVNYSHTLVIPDGSIAHDTTVFDDLDVELTFDSFGGAILGPDPIIGIECHQWTPGGISPLLAADVETFADVGGVARRQAWFVGDVQAVGGDCTIVLPYTVHLDLDANAGDTITNTAALRWNVTDEIAAAAPATLPTSHDAATDPGWDEAPAAVTESIGVVEPQLAIDADVSFAAGGPLLRPTCDTVAGNVGDADGTALDGCDTEVATNLRYRVTITNTGTSDAIDVAFDVTLDAELTPLDGPGGTALVGDGPVVGNSGSTMNWVESSRLLEATIGVLAPGATAQFDYDVVLPPGTGVVDFDDYLHLAHVDHYFGLPSAERSLNADVVTYGNSIGATRGSVTDDLVVVEAHTPDLVIVTTPAAGEDPTDVRLDEAFRWRIEVTNTDPTASAFDVDVVDDLPAGWSYVPLSAVVTTPYGVMSGPSAEPACVADVGACGHVALANIETVTWSAVVSGPAEPFGGAPGPAHTIVIEFDAVPSSQVLATIPTTGPAIHTNSATVSALDASDSAGDLDGPYEATASAQVFIRRVDLRIATQIEQVGPFYFGQDLTYLVTVSNDGPDDGTGITVTDVLPADVALNAVLAGTTGTYAADTWTIGALANGASATLRLDVEVRAAATITNVASIETSNQWDPDSTPGDGSLAGVDDDVDDVVFNSSSASLGDLVWFDVDGDGQTDLGEPGIPVVDLDVTFDLGDGVRQQIVTTNSSGAWTALVMPVDHPITVTVVGATLPGGLIQTADADGLLDATTVITVYDDTAVTDRDVGYTGINSVGGAIWFDVDANGAAAPELVDVPLVGVDVVLEWAGFDNIFDTADDVVYAAAPTDGSGDWLVPALADGDYRATVQPASLRHGIDVATYDVDGLGSPHMVTTTGVGAASGPAVVDTSFDLSYTATVGSIGDLVWLDTNADGDAAGEVGLADVDVTGVWQNPDGPDVVYVATTDVDGMYSLVNLPYGDVVVTVNNATLPGSLAPTSDHDDPAGGGGAATAHTSTATLSPLAASAQDHDFGYQGGNAVGDRVWIDVDGDADGQFDNNAIGIAGATVTLNWTPPVGDPEVRTTTTDANGFYLFSFLADGDVVVSVDPLTLPVGLTPNFDSDGTLTPHTSAAVLSGSALLDGDFSYVGAGSVGDTVWFDVNADGVIDSDEPGLSGVDVVVTWGGNDGRVGDDPATVGVDESLDDRTAVTTTDAAGNYLVANLALTEGAEANYEVAVSTPTLPSGVVATHDLDDPSGAIGAATPDSVRVRLDAATTAEPVANFGYRGSGEVGNTIWLDLDGSGTSAPDGAVGAIPAEPGIAGAEVEVVWTNPQGADYSTTVTTNTAGAWLVGGLPHGTITATVSSIEAGLVQTFGPNGAIPVAVTVLNGTDPSDLGLNFSFSGQATLGDRVWFDADAGAEIEPVGGMLDGQDQPLEAAQLLVTWAGFDGFVGDDPATTLINEAADDLDFAPVTDATGSWLLSNLPPGHYTVELELDSLPSGLTTVTVDPDGPATPDGSAALTLGATDDVRTVDFSVTGMGSLGDVVWLDLDRDGEFSTEPDAEVGLAGVDVTVEFAGPTGPVVWTTTTASDGSWLVNHLPFGVGIDVTVDAADLPGGVVSSYDLDDLVGASSTTPHQATAMITGLAPQRLDLDFGYVGQGQIGDQIWLDLDGDADPQVGAADVGLPNAAVSVTWTTPPGGGDELRVTRRTDAAGRFAVAGLPEGNYDVEVDPATLPDGVIGFADPDGATDPSGADHVAAVTLADDPGSTEIDESARLDVDFGYRGTASVGGLVWLDLNADGQLAIPETGGAETGVPGIDIALEFVDPISGLAFELPTTTSTDGAGEGAGAYLFEHLPAGAVSVSVDPTTVPSGYVFTYQRSDSDGGPPGATGRVEVDLDASVAVDDVDFGLRPEADVSVEVIGPDAFRVGEINTVSVLVSNAGPAAAPLAVVSAQLPAGLSFVDTVPSPSAWSCTVNGVDLECAYQPVEVLGSTNVESSTAAEASVLDVGESVTLAFAVEVGAHAVPSVSMSFAVASQHADPDVPNSATMFDAPTPLSVLEFDKSLTGSLVSGGSTTYLLEVRNAGPSPTRGDVVVVDSLPAGLTFVAAQGEGWTCQAVGADVRCTTGDEIAVGATASVQVTATVAAAPGASVANSASASGGNEVGGQQLDTDALAGVLASIDSGLAAQIGVDLTGPTASDGADSVSGIVQPNVGLARTGATPFGLSVAGATLLAVGLLLAGATLLVVGRRRLWHWLW